MEEMLNSTQDLAAIATTNTTGSSFSAVKLIEDIYESLGFPLLDPTISGQVFGVAMIIIAVLFVIVYIYSGFFTQKIFKKLGTTPSWSAWVPVYGQWKFLQAGKQQWWLVFIPVINVIFMIVAAYQIGVELRKGGGYVALYLLFPWLWLILLSSKRVTAISEGAVNEEYIPSPEESEVEPVQPVEGNSNDGNGSISSMVTDPTAAATAVAAVAASGLDGDPGFDPNNEAAGVKPEAAPKEKSMNPFPVESAFEMRQAEEKAKQQAEIEAANTDLSEQQASPNEVVPGANEAVVGAQPASSDNSVNPESQSAENRTA